jgi:hypothetical protein
MKPKQLDVNDEMCIRVLRALSLQTKSVVEIMRAADIQISRRDMAVKYIDVLKRHGLAKTVPRSRGCRSRPEYFHCLTELGMQKQRETAGMFKTGSP